MAAKKRKRRKRRKNRRTGGPVPNPRAGKPVPRGMGFPAHVGAEDGQRRVSPRNTRNTRKDFLQEGTERTEGGEADGGRGRAADDGGRLTLQLRRAGLGLQVTT